MLSSRPRVTAVRMAGVGTDRGRITHGRSLAAVRWAARPERFALPSTGRPCLRCSRRVCRLRNPRRAAGASLALASVASRPSRLLGRNRRVHRVDLSAHTPREFAAKGCGKRGVLRRLYPALPLSTPLLDDPYAERSDCLRCGSVAHQSSRVWLRASSPSSHAGSPSSEMRRPAS
jgi:hypothetical protein